MTATAITPANSLNTLADRINESHSFFEDAAREALSHAKDAGDALIEAKSQLPHGQFLPWLDLKQATLFSEKFEETRNLSWFHASD